MLIYIIYLCIYRVMSVVFYDCVGQSGQDSGLIIIFVIAIIVII